MSSHWYDSEGNTAYTVIGANGKERPTTLRDARKLNLVPSVTTILGAAANPGLNIYFQNQLLDAVQSVGYHDSDFWRDSVIHRSKEHSRKAAERGSVIHDSLEQYYLTGDHNSEDEFIQPVIDYMERTFPDVPWVSEASFTSTKYGYGGKVDLHSPLGIVLDFKTKDTADVKKMVTYDGHHMQTAAYTTGLLENGRFNDWVLRNPPDVSPDVYIATVIPGWIKRYNLFISTQTPGLITLAESTDFNRDWTMYYHLLKYWQTMNRVGGYDE